MKRCTRSGSREPLSIEVDEHAGHGRGEDYFVKLLHKPPAAWRGLCGLPSIPANQGRPPDLQPLQEGALQEGALVGPPIPQATLRAAPPLFPT